MLALAVHFQVVHQLLTVDPRKRHCGSIVHLDELWGTEWYGVQNQRACDLPAREALVHRAAARSKAS